MIEAQRYIAPMALRRMARGECPECGGRAAEHAGAGKWDCTLTDTGVARRISQYEKDMENGKARAALAAALQGAEHVVDAILSHPTEVILALVEAEILGVIEEGSTIEPVQPEAYYWLVR